MDKFIIFNNKIINTRYIRLIEQVSVINPTQYGIRLITDSEYCVWYDDKQTRDEYFLKLELKLTL